MRAKATDPTYGVAGYFTNNSTYSTVNLANSGIGQVLYLGNGYDGSDPLTGGPFIQAVDVPGATLFQVKKNGDVAQARDADGLVKAAAWVECGGSGTQVYRSFNQVGGTITVSHELAAGFCVIDFGFNLNDRYFSATPVVGGAYSAGVSCGLQVSQLVCFRYDGTTGLGWNGEIVVLIY